MDQGRARSLSGWPESAARERSTRWLDAAQEALEERNRLLHSVPVTVFTRADDGALTVQGQALDYLPRRADQPFTRMALAEDELRDVRQKLAEAREGWTGVCTALMEERKRNDRM